MTNVWPLEMLSYSCVFLVESFNVFNFQSIEGYSYTPLTLGLFFPTLFSPLNPHLNAEPVLQQMPP